ncbi:MAG: hypothetical protein GX045_02710 [Clostridiaceae bacterium]|nr:hypothetical protein [Clostridiaceae bacterium]
MPLKMHEQAGKTRLPHYYGSNSGKTDVKTDPAAPDMNPPDAIEPDMSAPDYMKSGQRLPMGETKARFDIAEDMPLIIQDESDTIFSSGSAHNATAGDTPVSSGTSSVIMDMGDEGQISGSSSGTAADALANPITVRIYNQKGLYFDSMYYMNIGFINRYEISEDFADFINSYIN